MDQELADTAAYVLGDAAYALTRRQHFSAWNDVMTAILKLCGITWRTILQTFILIQL